MTMTKNRSTARAGELQAGDPLPLVDLLAFGTADEGRRVIALISERIAQIEAAAADHAAGAEDAALAGEEAEAAHADAARRLEREARRLRLALERAGARTAELAAEEHRAAVARRVAGARKAAARAEQLVNEYEEAARRVGELLAELAEVEAEIEQARREAAEAGVEVGDALALPHERRTQPELVEEREVLVRQAGVRITDEHGRVLNPAEAAREEAAPIRRIEHVVIRRARIAPRLTECRIALPSADDRDVLLVDRGR